MELLPTFSVNESETLPFATDVYAPPFTLTFKFAVASSKVGIILIEVILLLTEDV